MKRLWYLTPFLVIASVALGATFTTLKVGDGSPIDPSAALEVKSTVGAFLAPRMSATQKNAIPSPKNGDLVYDTTVNQFSGYSAGSWQSIGGGSWGSITGTLSAQTDLQNALNLKAPLASPTFTGTVTGTFSGNLTGAASQGATVASTTNASYFPLFAASSSNSNQPFNLGAGLSFNPSTNNLATTTFTGALAGNASTSTALASTPAQCSSGNYSTGITAGGVANCAVVNYNQLGGVLPNPSSSTLGGIQSKAAVTHNWINSISTSGVPSLTQPAFGDISGSLASTQLPNPMTLAQIAVPSNPSVGFDSIFFSGDILSWQASNGLTFSLQNPSGSTIIKSLTTGAPGFAFTTGAAQQILDSGGVTPISATIIADGGDIEVGLQDDGTNVGEIQADQAPTDSGFTLSIYRDGVAISNQLIYLQNNIGIEIHYSSLTQFRFIDTPSAGTHVYTAYISAQNTPRTTNYVTGAIIFARRTGGTSINATGQNLFTSTQVAADSSFITSGSMTTFSNSPALPITPMVTGTYRIWLSAAFQNQSSATNGFAQIINTSGGAVLQSQNLVGFYAQSGAAFINNAYLVAYYTLTAGTTYVFDVQGNSTGSGISLLGSTHPWYMYGELSTAVVQYGVTSVGTFGSTPTANGANIATSTLTLQPADGTHPGSITSGSQTIGGVKTFSSAPVLSGASITSGTVPLGAVASIANGTVLGNSSGSSGPPVALGTSASDKVILGNASSTAIHTINGGINFSTNTQTGSYTIDNTTTDYELLMNCSAACNLTLPAPTNGRHFEIVDINGQSQLNNITLVRHGSEKINGVAASFILAGNAGSWAISTNGTDWFVKFNPAPTWAFGAGTDGAQSVTSNNLTAGPLTAGALTRDAYWSKLTMGASGVIKTSGFKIFAQVCDFTNAITGAITATPAAAGNGATAATAGAAGALPYAAAGTLGVSTVGIIGGVGTATTGTQGATAVAVSPGMGGPSGAGAIGGTGTGGAGGAARAAVAVTTPFGMPRFTTELLRGIVLGQGGGGAPGGSGAGGNTTAGGGGGGGGAGGGVVYVACGTVVRGTNSNASIIQAIGGQGGNGGTTVTAGAGGGSGGPGGGGGEIYFLYSFETGTAITNGLDASGGLGGSGGNATLSPGTGGDGAGGGGGGRIDVFNLTTGIGTETFGGAATTGNAHSTLTGGGTKAGQVTQANL